MSRSQKLLAVALTVSVALNLFAGGAFLSRHFFGPPHHDWASKREAAEVLPEAERERIHEIWERGRDNRHDDFKAMRDARQRYREVLTAERFDPAAAEAALAALYARRDAAREAIEQKILEIATSLPPEQRRAYFTAFFADEVRRDREWERRAREREGERGEDREQD